VNAGGRVGEAGLGARLLATEDAAEAAVLASRLDGFNTERREIEARVLAAAIEGVERETTPSPLVFAVGANWHPGVIGIVASRLKERYNRPACVVALENGTGKGSGRSVSGFGLGDAVIAARQAGLLVNGGGHAMAAGFTVARERIDALHDFLAARVAATLGTEKLVPELALDGAVAAGAATPELIATLEALAPFGAGNAEPRFGFPGVRVVTAEVVGGAHVRAILTDAAGTARLKAIAFRCVETALGPALLQGAGATFHVAGTLRADNWNGETRVQLCLGDAAPAFA
jgi:single-stranded-DNA-specific exonuclease